MMEKLKERIKAILEDENYAGLQIKNEDELRDKLEKYDIDIDDYFKTNKKLIRKYPVHLNFTKTVLEINDEVASFLEKNLDYYQFLLDQTSDFILV